ncbi:hypothetical protein PMAC_002530 [Pneumocystis sp. 'macacae']|nr:hypothetical protein PMAC_002530 [Pneumocystis sp. 'macacae']
MTKEGIIAINKPSGWICTHILKELQKILRKSRFYHEFVNIPDYKRQRKSKNLKYGRIKLGHGGTLDPLASGVLVVGIGKGTKNLEQFLQCTKVLKRMPWSHLNKVMVEKALDNFKGNILQKPPIFSALHMKGKRLYEYVREGLELPEEIKSRPIVVESFDIIRWTHDHEWKEPKDSNNIEKDLEISLEKEDNTNCKSDGSDLSRNDEIEITDVLSDTNKRKLSDNLTSSVKKKAPAVTFRVVVSSGTYIRSLIHDLGVFLGSAAHIVELIRYRQGKYKLNENTIEWSKFENGEWENDFIKAISLKNSLEP